MKKKFFFALVGLVLAGASLMSCNAQSRIESLIIKEIRSNLPISLGMVGDMTEVNLVDGNMEFTIRCDETYVNLKEMQRQPDKMRETMKQSMLAQKDDPNVKMLIDEFVKMGKGITYKFIGKDSGTSSKVSLTADDLKEIKESQTSVDDVEKLLQMKVQSSILQCPMDLGNGLVWTKTTIEGDNVIYYYEIDEDFQSLDAMRSNKELIHQSLLKEAKNMAQNDPTFKTFVKLCNQTHRGFAYRYIGNTSGDSVTFLITADELKNL